MSYFRNETWMDLDASPIYHRKMDVIIHASWVKKKEQGSRIFQGTLDS